MMRLLTHGGEHHENGDGGWLMMTMENGLQICPPEEEQGLAAALYRKTQWILLSNFFLPESEYMELELRSMEVRGTHKTWAPLGGVPSTLVDRWWVPSGWFFRQYFLLIPKLISVKFQVILRTFYSAQK